MEARSFDLRKYRGVYYNGEYHDLGYVTDELTWKRPPGKCRHGALYVTENGIYNADDDKDFDAYSEVIVDVPMDPNAKYTVTFKNWDGTVLQEVKEVPLLGSAKYTGETPKPQNYDPSDPFGCDQFIGWYPSPTFVTKNTTCEAKFVPSTYYGDTPIIHDTWEEICANKGAKYNIGDSKILYLSAFNCHLKMIKVYEGEDGSTSTWISLSPIRGNNDTAFKVPLYNTTSGSWKDSNLRQYVQSTVFESLPTILKNSIVSVHKRQRALDMSQYGSGSYQSTPYLEETIDNIWTPSLRELTASPTDSNRCYTSASGNSLSRIYTTESNQITYANAITSFTTVAPNGSYIRSEGSTLTSCIWLRTVGEANQLARGVYINNAVDMVNDKIKSSLYGGQLNMVMNIMIGFCL